jgi:hypothetical protein
MFQEHSDPLVRARAQNGPPLLILFCHAGARAEENRDDLRLLASCARRSRSTTSGILHSEMERGRPILVLQMHVGAAGQQGSYGLRRTGSHGAMERRHAATIERVRIGSGEQEVRDRVALCRRVPSICVGGIVQRLGTPPISGTTARATSY